MVSSKLYRVARKLSYRVGNICTVSCRVASVMSDSYRTGIIVYRVVGMVVTEHTSYGGYYTCHIVYRVACRYGRFD